MSIALSQKRQPLVRTNLANRKGGQDENEFATAI